MRGCRFGACTWPLLVACAASKPAAPPTSPPIAPTQTATTSLPTVATPPPVVAPSQPSFDAAWGTADPATVVAASPDRRWLALCQARRDTNGDGKVSVEVGPQGDLGGDALEGYFADEPGTGVPVESFVGSDPSGRFVALVEGGKLLLRDTTTRMATDLTALGADVRDDLAPFVAPRSGSFDPTGRRFAYLRRDAAGTHVVVRELATGAETVVEPGTGEVYRASFDVTGDWVLVRVVAADTNGNGRLEWPVPVAAAPYMRCTGPLPRYPVWERGGDDAVMRLAKASGGAAVDAPDLVAPFGSELIVRNPDGALARMKPGGPRLTIVRPGCTSHLLHADALRDAVLVTCLGTKGKSDALLIAKGGVVKSMGIELSAASGDRVVPGAPQLVALHPGMDAVLVDMESKRPEKLTAGDRVLAVEGTRALVLRAATANKKQLVIHDFGGVEYPIPGDVLPLYRLLRTGPAAFVSPFVVDVARGVPFGTVSNLPLALSSDGAVLSATEDPDATHLARGPLRWTKATPLGEPVVRTAE